MVDCFFNLSGDSDFSSVAATHQALIDQVVEVNEELMTLYLEQGEELAPEQLHSLFGTGPARGPSDPVCFVSARSGAGVAELLTCWRVWHPTPPKATRRAA